MNELRITSDENGCTQIFLNGIDISTGCGRFALEQIGGESPVFRVEIATSKLDVFMKAVSAVNVGDRTKTPEEYETAVRSAIPKAYRKPKTE